MLESMRFEGGKDHMKTIVKDVVLWRKGYGCWNLMKPFEVRFVYVSSIGGQHEPQWFLALDF